MARSCLSRRNFFHIGEISFVSQKYLSSRRDLVSISPEIVFISCRSQRNYKSRRVLDEISARSRLTRRDLRVITNVAELLARSWRNLVISPSSRRDFVNLDEISFISARSRRDLRDITNLAEISSRLTRSRRDLCHVGEISLISPRSQRDLVYLA